MAAKYWIGDGVYNAVVYGQVDHGGIGDFMTYAVEMEGLISLCHPERRCSASIKRPRDSRIHLVSNILNLHH